MSSSTTLPYVIITIVIARRLLLRRRKYRLRCFVYIFVYIFADIDERNANRSILPFRRTATTVRDYCDITRRSDNQKQMSGTGTFICTTRSRQCRTNFFEKYRSKVERATTTPTRTSFQSDQLLFVRENNRSATFRRSLFIFIGFMCRKFVRSLLFCSATFGRLRWRLIKRVFDDTRDIDENLKRYCGVRLRENDEKRSGEKIQ